MTDFDKWLEMSKECTCDPGNFYYDTGPCWYHADEETRIKWAYEAGARSSQFHAPKEDLVTSTPETRSAPNVVDESSLWAAAFDYTTEHGGNEYTREAFVAGANHAARLGLIARVEDVWPSDTEITSASASAVTPGTHTMGFELTKEQTAFIKGASWILATLRKRISGES